jgi:hypothetical protein
VDPHGLDQICINSAQARLYHEGDFLIMKATRSIRGGDEIFNDYGPLPRSDLLRMYGYTTEHYAQYDVVELSSQAIYEVAEATRKKHKKSRTTVSICSPYQAESNP